MQSVSTLFMAMTAIAQKVRAAGEKIMTECEKVKQNNEAIDDIDSLLWILEGVVEKPLCLDSVTSDMKDCCVSALGTRTMEHPLVV